MPTPTTTPTADKTERTDTMTFPEAITALIAGSKVTKLEWKSPETYLYLDGRLKIRKEDGKINDLIVSDGDMLGMDWVIVNPE